MNYTLTAKIEDQNFEQSVDIFTIPKRYSVLVQTDKPMYKPSDTINFRVLTLDSEFKPYRLDGMKIELLDPFENVMQVFDPFTISNETSQNEISEIVYHDDFDSDNIGENNDNDDDNDEENNYNEGDNNHEENNDNGGETHQNQSKNEKKTLKELNNLEKLLQYGVLTYQFKLGNETFLDTWTLRVSTFDNYTDENVNNTVITDHKFNVSEYVLPRFEVFIETKSNVILAEGIIKLFISAKYTFDQYVTGKAKIDASTFDTLYPNVIKHSVQKTIEVNFTEPIIFDLQHDLRIYNGIRPYLVKFNVEFEETLTGQVMNSKTEVRVSRNVKHSVEIVTAQEKFKPGFTYKIKVLVKKYDGTFVTNQIEDVKFNVKLFYSPAKCAKLKPDLIQSFEYNENRNLRTGTVIFDLKVPENTTAISIKASYLEYEDKINVERLDGSRSREYLELKSAFVE